MLYGVVMALYFADLPIPIVDDVITVEGGTARLKCNVEGARPHPTELRWYYNGIQLENERYGMIFAVHDKM